MPPARRKSRANLETPTKSAKDKDDLKTSLPELSEQPENTSENSNTKPTYVLQNMFKTDFLNLLKECESVAADNILVEEVAEPSSQSTNEDNNNSNSANPSPGNSPTNENSDESNQTNGDETEPPFDLSKLKPNITKPALLCAPNCEKPTHFYFRNFQIDALCMQSFLKAIDNPSIYKNISINISVCKLTNETFDVLIKNGNFNIIKHLTIIGNLPVSTSGIASSATIVSVNNERGALLQQLLNTPVKLGELFNTKLESLTMKNMNLTDDFLDTCVPSIQKNESLTFLNLDFNHISKRNHIDKILRVNRKLIAISIRSAKNLNCQEEFFNEPREIFVQPNDESENSNEASSSGKKSRGSATPSNSDRPTSQKSVMKVQEPEMLIMNPEELREYRRYHLYKEEVLANNSVPKIFLSDKIERRDKKVYFPGNQVFKRLIF